MTETHDLVSRRGGTDSNGEEYYRPAVADVDDPPMKFIIEHLDALVDPDALPHENEAVIGYVEMEGGSVVDWGFDDEYYREVDGPFYDEGVKEDMAPEKTLPEGALEEGYYITHSVSGQTTIQTDDGSPWAQRYAEMV